MGCCCKKPAGDANNNNDAVVLKALANSAEPLKADQVAEMCGLDKDVVSKCLTSLKDAGKISSPKRCFYSVAEPKTE